MNTQNYTPPLFVCPGYQTLFPNDHSSNPTDMLQGLPLFATIWFVVERQAQVQYCFGDNDIEMKHLNDMRFFLEEHSRNYLNEFIKNNPNVYLFNNMATFKFIMIALQVCNWDNNNELSTTDITNIYKAYLCCNDIWTLEQEKGFITGNILAEKSIMADVPIIEFKHHKDYRPQLFKAWRLFHFMQNNAPYDGFLSMFLKQHNISSWQEYIAVLFSFYSCTLDKSIIRIGANDSQYIPFFDELCINKDKCQDIWDRQDFNYLRNHPLIKKDCLYLVLNPNLLIDRIYQGLKFSIYAVIKNNNPLNKKGKPLKDFGEFASMLGNDFSEKEVFYYIMRMAFDGIADKSISGAEMDLKKIKGPSDYYIRIGKKVYLFEYKDVTLADNVKYSCDYDTIKKEFLNRISKDENNVRKGVGQLLFSINEIVNNNSMKAIDADIDTVTAFYPIVVTTDKTFSSLGVQYLLVESCNNLIKKWNLNTFVNIPMVLDLDTLFLMSPHIHSKTINFPTIIDNYLQLKDNKLASFYMYYTDKYKKDHPLSENDMNYLFGGLINSLKQRSDIN
jgi:hypothetical protein